MNGLHIWKDPFVSKKAKKNLKEAIRDRTDCIQFTTMIVSHVLDAHPFQDKNFETAAARFKSVLGCTGYRLVVDDSELERFLLSIRDCKYGCYSQLYDWLIDRVKRIDGKPEDQIY